LKGGVKHLNPRQGITTGVRSGQRYVDPLD